MKEQENPGFAERTLRRIRVFPSVEDNFIKPRKLVLDELSVFAEGVLLKFQKAFSGFDLIIESLIRAMVET